MPAVWDVLLARSQCPRPQGGQRGRACREAPSYFKTVNGAQLYLSDEDFQEIFKMDRAAWDSKKPWQKIELKKELELF